ncbi:unnamed protein product [Closterium sp. NIES-64]|nr:unnamed protein product [Closterium sp. NIES-64]
MPYRNALATLCARRQVDLTKGYYDSGDNVKYGLPMAFTVTTLAWSVVEYGSTLAAQGQLDHALDAIRWGTDFFISAHPQPNVLYAQVGDGPSDHRCWQRPEDMTTPRMAFRLDANNPGTEVAAEAAAALAAASMAFASRDEEYSRKLIRHAKELFNFANTYRKSYVSSIPSAAAFYNSYSGFNVSRPSPARATSAHCHVRHATRLGVVVRSMPSHNSPHYLQNSIARALDCPSPFSPQDELLWAAAWLQRATGEAQYLAFVKKNNETLQGATTSMNAFSWDNKFAGAQILLSKVFFKARDPGLYGYQLRANDFVCATVVRGTRTPGEPHAQRATDSGGLLFVQPWSNLQYVTAVSLLIAVYSDYLDRASVTSVQCDSTAVTPAAMRKFVAKQVPRGIVSAETKGWGKEGAVGGRGLHFRLPLCAAQMSYLLGENPRRMSYMVGYGASFPMRVHHRGASIVSIKKDPRPVGCEEGFKWFHTQVSAFAVMIAGTLTRRQQNARRRSMPSPGRTTVVMRRKCPAPSRSPCCHILPPTRSSPFCAPAFSSAAHPPTLHLFFPASCTPSHPMPCPLIIPPTTPVVPRPAQAPNANVLVGAVVGGPDNMDAYKDVRDNYQQSEVSTYVNSPLVGALARLLAGNAPLPPNQQTGKGNWGGGMGKGGGNGTRNGSSGNKGGGQGGSGGGSKSGNTGDKGGGEKSSSGKKPDKDGKKGGEGSGDMKYRNGTNKSRGGSSKSGNKNSGSNKPDGSNSGSKKSEEKHSGSNKSGGDKFGSNKLGSNNSGSNKSGSNKSGSDNSGSNKSGSNKPGSNKSGSDKSGSNKSDSHDSGSNKSGSSKSRSNKSGSGKSGSNKSGGNDSGLKRADSTGTQGPSTSFIASVRDAEYTPDGPIPMRTAQRANIGVSPWTGDSGVTGVSDGGIRAQQPNGLNSMAAAGSGASQWQLLVTTVVTAQWQDVQGRSMAQYMVLLRNEGTTMLAHIRLTAQGFHPTSAWGLVRAGNDYRVLEGAGALAPGQTSRFGYVQEGEAASFKQALQEEA